MRFGLSILVGLSIFLSGCASQMLKVVPGESKKAQTTAPKNLSEECDRISEIYPLLMLTVMMEGPMTCGDPHMGDEPFPCDELDAAEEKAARAERLAIRKKQEAAAKTANEACELYKENPGNSDYRLKAKAAIAASRATDKAPAN